jgi:glycosyltransferase involved in cell wall biosynthesis
MKLSIIIPVYNEFRTFSQVLERVRNAPLPAGVDKEIIVVDDGSTDGTSSLVAGCAGTVVVHHSILNFGKGTAIRIGITKATGDVILTQDGDLEYDPNDYAAILQPFIDAQADVVYGSRFRRGHPMMAWKNWLANRILTTATNLLFAASITDEATAYKAFRTPVLRRIALQCRRFEFCPEVTAKIRRIGCQIREVPISYNARGIADGKKIRAADGFIALWTLIRYRFASRRSVLAKAPAANPVSETQPVVLLR